MYCVGSIVSAQGCTHPRQLVSLHCALCYYWSDRLFCSSIFINRNARRTLENCAAGNFELTTEDLAELSQAMTVNPVRGTRY